MASVKSSLPFLTASALGAANTANAVRPVARSGPLAMPSFINGWLTSELPVQTIAWQAAATALTGVRHGFKSRRCRLALGLNVASWAALAALHVQARRADRVFAPALESGLGNRLRRDPASTQALTAAQLARPFASGRDQYLAAADISYGDAGVRNQLDVWRDPQLPRDSRAPVLLQVHGGAWMTGNKRQQGVPLMTEMCRRGWVCVAINYRLSPRATWPDHVVDVKRAIAWIRAHIHEYGGDPDDLSITGGSAGGHLSSLTALTANDPAFQPGFEDVDTTIRAAAPMYGVYDFCNRDGTASPDLEGLLRKVVMKGDLSVDPDAWEAASPMARITPEAPPFMVVHGTNDSLVPVEQARSFVTMMRATSRQPVVYAELPGTQHAFDIFASVRTIHTVRAIGDFLQSVGDR
jgi:acetyl esterase/lipase